MNLRECQRYITVKESDIEDTIIQANNNGWYVIQGRVVDGRIREIWLQMVYVGERARGLQHGR